MSIIGNGVFAGGNGSANKKDYLFGYGDALNYCGLFISEANSGKIASSSLGSYGAFMLTENATGSVSYIFTNSKSSEGTMKITKNGTVTTVFSDTVPAYGTKTGTFSISGDTNDRFTVSCTANGQLIVCSLIIEWE